MLYSFTGGSDGAAPFAGVVIGSGGVLYGTAAYTARGRIFRGSKGQSLAGHFPRDSMEICEDELLPGRAGVQGPARHPHAVSDAASGDPREPASWTRRNQARRRCQSARSSGNPRLVDFAFRSLNRARIAGVTMPKNMPTPCIDTL